MDTFPSTTGHAAEDIQTRSLKALPIAAAAGTASTLLAGAMARRPR